MTAFPGKLKGVLHSQDDGTNIFPSQPHNMSELCAFHHEHHNFSKFSKKFSPLRCDAEQLVGCSYELGHIHAVQFLKQQSNGAESL